MDSALIELFSRFVDFLKYPISIVQIIKILKFVQQKSKNIKANTNQEM
jgi:hypothetical protein